MIKALVFSAITFLLIYSFLEMNHHSLDEIKYKLSSVQKANLTEKIGSIGMANLEKTNCEQVVAEYLNTKKWTDVWCARHYRHITYEF